MGAGRGAFDVGEAAPHTVCTNVYPRETPPPPTLTPSGCPIHGRSVATTWVPIGARVPVLFPNDHPNPSQRRQKGFGKMRIFGNFPPTCQRENGQVLAGKGPGRGRGTRSSDPRPPPLVRGGPGPCTRKTCSGPGSKLTYTLRKTILTPTPLPNKWRQDTRGWLAAVNIKKICWGIVLSPKAMILQGVGHPISCFNVCYANAPKQGDIRRPCLRLISEPLFEVILHLFRGETGARLSVGTNHWWGRAGTSSLGRNAAQASTPPQQHPRQR